MCKTGARLTCIEWSIWLTGPGCHREILIDRWIERGSDLEAKVEKFTMWNPFETECDEVFRDGCFNRLPLRGKDQWYDGSNMTITLN